MHLLHEVNNMITKLLPDKISKFWDIIQYAISQSLPPTVGDHPDKMNRILSSALSGSIDIWASYNKKDEKGTFEGIVLTKFLYDDSSGTNNLLIYCLYGYKDVNRSSWMDGYKALSKYAKSKNCSRIIAYTDVPALIEKANRFGGNTQYTLISVDIDNELEEDEV